MPKEAYTHVKRGQHYLTPASRNTPSAEQPGRTRLRMPSISATAKSMSTPADVAKGQSRALRVPKHHTYARFFSLKLASTPAGVCIVCVCVCVRERVLCVCD